MKKSLLMMAIFAMSPSALAQISAPGQEFTETDKIRRDLFIRWFINLATLVIVCHESLVDDKGKGKGSLLTWVCRRGMRT